FYSFHNDGQCRSYLSHLIADEFLHLLTAKKREVVLDVVCSLANVETLFSAYTKRNVSPTPCPSLCTRISKFRVCMPKTAVSGFLKTCGIARNWFGRSAARFISSTNESDDVIAIIDGGDHPVHINFDYSLEGRPQNVED
ncbi:hypothetical protein PFISCL1PPCAC_22003, partial [Pristionchus fissidentatus]